MNPLPYSSTVPLVKRTPLSRSPLPPLCYLMLGTYPPSLVCDYHSQTTQKTFHAVLVLSGRMIFQEKGGPPIETSSGSILVIPKRSTLRWETCSQCKLFHCMHTGFNLRQHGLLGTLYGPLQQRLTAVSAGPSIVETVTRRLELASRSPARDIHHSLSALLLLEAGLEAARETEKHTNPVTRALRYIENHLHEPFNMEDLAHHCGLGSNRLTQLFRQQIGTAPMRHAAKRRATVATTLLETGGMNVSEVAEHLGFSSVSYFSRFFKQQTGRPPSTHLGAA